VTTLGELAASIAHEIDQPLAAIAVSRSIARSSRLGPTRRSCRRGFRPYYPPISKKLLETRTVTVANDI